MLLIDSTQKMTKLIDELSDDITIYGTGTIARKFALQIRYHYGNLDTGILCDACGSGSTNIW